MQQAIHKNLKGHTVIVIAHRLSTIESADKIIVIDHGEIVETGKIHLCNGMKALFILSC